MRRRSFLAGGAGAVAALSTQSMVACSSPTENPPASTDALPEAVAKLRAQYVADFDADYVDNVIVPSFMNSIFDGQRPVLPMIDVALTKENALPITCGGCSVRPGSPLPKTGSRSSFKGWRSAAPTTGASGSTCRR
jgi:hypothetical protein